LILIQHILLTLLLKKDKDSPSTSTAKSSRRDSLNERVVNAQSSSYEQEQQQTQPQNALQSAPIQSPPIHQMMQPQHFPEPIKQEPVRSPNTNK
jgi:hypothetical protein